MPGSSPGMTSGRSVPLLGQHRQGMKLDAFLVQLLGVLRRSLAVDRAMLDLAVMHLARDLGKFLPDIVGVRGQVIAQLLELLAKLALLRRDHRDRRRRLRLRRRGRGFLGRRHDRSALVRARKARRHDGLLDLRGAADRAGDELALDLLVVGGRTGEPALEFVAPVADQRIADHESAPTTCRCVGSAIGSSTSKRRPCCSDGMRLRAVETSAGSMSAKTTPGSVPPSARIRPHGSTTTEWPKGARPFSCSPPCAAANTNEPVSIARARISTCQCASPVCLVKAEGMARNVAPASASAR